jgi:hypothetical protein
MGRPINKRYFGTTGGDGATVFTPTGANLPIRFKSGGSVYEGYIVKQKAARRFLCSTDDGTTAQLNCKLVQGTNSDPTNNGEATLVGLVNGSQPVTLQKLTNRIAVDFEGKRYAWTLSDDSTETLIVLTAL